MCRVRSLRKSRDHYTSVPVYTFVTSYYLKLMTVSVDDGKRRDRRATQTTCKTPLDWDRTLTTLHKYTKCPVRAWRSYPLPNVLVRIVADPVEWRETLYFNVLVFNIVSYWHRSPRTWSPHTHRILSVPNFTYLGFRSNTFRHSSSLHFFKKN